MNSIGNVARKGEKGCVQGFCEKARLRETTRKLTRRMEDDIKVDLGILRWGSMDWIHLARNRGK